MDFDKAKRRQSLKVIVSELIMVITVIITVVILALLVSGYWLNENFEVERQGMLQIYSTPTGADVAIDGESSWLQRTNTSKVLTSGEHTVTLTKDGYDSWSKTITITEGLLYRLHYPRLFPENRTAETVLDVSGTTFATISPDHNSLLLSNNTTKWGLVKLSSDTVTLQDISVAGLFSDVQLAAEAETGLFTGKILQVDWDRDGSHALFRVQSGDKLEWVLLDVKNIAKSLNLTREFNADFSDVQILDNSSSNLIVVENRNLRKIDVSGRSISTVIVPSVVDVDHYNNEIVFSAAQPSSAAAADDSLPYYVGYLKTSDDAVTALASTPAPAKVAISRFYDQKYITILTGDTVSVHLKDDFEDSVSYQIDFAPESLEVGHDGEFILMSAGTNIATLDMESSTVSEWSVAGDSFDWLDNDMLYTVSDGQLIVYDYDGLNRRSLAANVSSRFPAGITDNKWLYYFSDDQLIREWLVEH